MKHENNFDLLRLFAASEVMTSHAIQHLKLPVWPWVAEVVVSFPGVPVFFVISGFLITGTFFDRNGEIVPYFVNRALRIYPGMWLNLVFIFAMMLSFGIIDPQKIPHLSFIGLSAIMAITGSMPLSLALSPYPFDWSGPLPFFPGGALWTIVAELGFYVMVPLVFFGPFKTNKLLALLWLGAWAAASYAFNLYLSAHPSDLLRFASPFPYFWIFAIGSACKLAWPEIRFMFEGRALYWLAAFEAVWIGLRFSSAGLHFPEYQVPGLANTGLVLLLAGLTISCAFSRPTLAKVLRGNDFSYGLYLNHMPVISIFLALGLIGQLWMWPAFYGAAFALAAASWFLVERPFLKLKPRAATDRQPPPVSSSSAVGAVEVPEQACRTVRLAAGDRL